VSGGLARIWLAWVRLWEGTEHPRSLALVRILLGLVILWDFVEIARLDLVVALFVDQAAGGLSDAGTRSSPPWIVAWFGAGETTGRVLHATITFAAASFVLGLFTRTSALVLLVAWAQFAGVLPAADRGIDTLCRDVLVVFLFARSGGWLSIDAVRRTGSVWGDGTPVPAWPRRLLILQLVAMYFLAGIQKTGVHWWPMGHFAALYFILQDPAIAKHDFRFLANPPWFQLSQIGTAVTVLFQDSYPIVLLIRWCKATADRGGALREWLVRYGWIEWVWIALGGVFHLGLATTMELGIFPWAMLALYPAWVHPDDWPRVVAWIRARTGR
jgi:hypothetical protein